MAYLDETGLAYLWARMKAYVAANSAGGVTLASVYPVGSIYMSVSSTSPATLFGGTWEQIQDRFLLAAGTSYAAGAEGGEASHALTSSEMPSHSHSLGANVPACQSAFGGESGGSLSGSAQKYVKYSSSASLDNKTATGSAGSGSAHNNMPPYLAVYVWRRTA